MQIPTRATAASAVRKASFFYFVFVMFSYTTGGPFGLEGMVTTSGPGMSLIYLLIIPFFLSIPVSLVSAELTTAMPVEGGFYRWTRAAFGDFWGFLAGWWNWSASFLLGGSYAVLFTDYLTFYFPAIVRRGDVTVLKTRQGEIQAKAVITCGGLQSDLLAKMTGGARDPGGARTEPIAERSRGRVERGQE